MSFGLVLYELALGWRAVVSRDGQPFQLASGLIVVMKYLALDLAYLPSAFKINASALLADFDVFLVQEIVVCMRIVLLNQIGVPWMWLSRSRKR